MSKQRLIDADALEKRLDNEKWMDNYDRDFIVDVALDEAPTVDAAPVVHGRWDFSGVFGGNLIYQCNLCGRIIVLHEHGDLKKEFPYCHCGARMDGKDK